MNKYSLLELMYLGANTLEKNPYTDDATEVMINGGYPELMVGKGNDTFKHMRDTKFLFNEYIKNKNPELLKLLSEHNTSLAGDKELYHMFFDTFEPKEEEEPKVLEPKVPEPKVPEPKVLEPKVTEPKADLKFEQILGAIFDCIGLTEDSERGKCRKCDKLSDICLKEISKVVKPSDVTEEDAKVIGMYVECLKSNKEQLDNDLYTKYKERLVPEPNHDHIFLDPRIKERDLCNYISGLKNHSGLLKKVIEHRLDFPGAISMLLGSKSGVEGCLIPAIIYMPNNRYLIDNLLVRTKNFDGAYDVAREYKPEDTELLSLLSVAEKLKKYRK